VTPVAVTPRSFREVAGGHHERLRANGLEPRFPGVSRPLREGEMVRLVRGCPALIVGVDPVTEAVMAAGPLRLVVKYGSGLDNVDLEAAGRLGVRVVPTPGTNAASVAELTIALMLALARHVVPHHRAMRDGTRQRRLGVELAGRRLGIVGLGSIGRRVARSARCLGMEVVAHDPHVPAGGVELVSWERVLECHVLSLHVPYGDDTHHLVDGRALAAMRSDALLLNTARPAIVDAAALAEALEAGRIAGAAFDDLGDDERVAARLLASDRFIATPHCGAATLEAVTRTASAAVGVVLEHRGLWQDEAQEA
jgi:D-3-phosphoglycerate dehydrogenase / 2-oxoglutarate reductase